MWLICQIHGVAHGVGPESRIFNGACEQRGESQINFAAEFIVCENIPSIPLNFTEPLREKGHFPLSLLYFHSLYHPSTVFNLKPIFPIFLSPSSPSLRIFTSLYALEIGTEESVEIDFFVRRIRRRRITRITKEKREKGLNNLAVPNSSVS